MDDDRTYQALALPDEALSNGGTEILRAGLINGELFVTAHRAFKDPAKWGDMLADIARRVALLYSAEDTDLTEHEVLAEIEEAFAADLGARTIKARRTKRAVSRKAVRPVKRKAVKKSARAARKRKKR